MARDFMAPAVQGRTHAALAWLWLLAALPHLTDAACPLPVGLLLFATWVLLAVSWLAVGVFSRSRTGRLWWLAAGVAGCLGVVLAFTDIGLIARVAVSRPWLDVYARQVTPGTAAAHEPRWVGLFLVEQTEEEGGVVFLYTSRGFINRNGLAYVPQEEGTVRFGGRRINDRLHGFWHSFEWKF
jgi:hypothetical protein